MRQMAVFENLWNIKFLCGTLLLFVSSATTSTHAETKDESVCAQAATILREAPLLETPSTETNSALHKDRIERYKTAIKLCPSMAEAYYNLGIFQLREKSFANGIENLKKAHERKPENSQFLAAYATGALESGDQMLAQTLYKQALQLDPHSIKALQGLSIVSERTGDLKLAEQYMLRADKEDPNDEVTLFNLALLMEKQSSLPEAAKVYERLLKVNPSNSQAANRLAVIYINQDRSADAQQLLALILERTPRDVDALKISASLQSQANDQGKAILSLKRALEVEPDNKKILLPLATMLLKQGSADEARKLVERASIKNPSDNELQDLLGQAAMELGDLVLAEDSFKRSLALNALSARTHYNYSVLLRRLGRTHESQQQREAALKIDATLVREAEVASRNR